MTTLELIELIVLALTVCCLAIYYLVKAIKNHWLSKISSEVFKAMKEAEKSGLSGSAKKEYVLEKVEALCKELDVPYTFIKKLIDKLIEKTIKSYNNMTK